MYTSRFCTAVWTVGLTAVAGIALAQQPAQPGQPRETLRAGAAQSDKLTGQDLPLAQCLAIENQKEVQLAQFAADKTQSPEVKQFTQKLIEDHGQLLNKLHQLTGGKTPATGQPSDDPRARSGRQPNERRPDQTTTDRPNETAADRPAAENQPGIRSQDQADRPQRDAQATTRQSGRQAAANRQSIDFVALKAELAEECLKSAKAELGEKSGKEFDKCYMFGQVMAHMAMKDALTVFDRHASPELKQVIAEAKTTTQQHLDQAKQIVEKLDSDSPDQELGRRTTPLNR